MSKYVEILMINGAGAESPLADPYVCMVGTVNGTMVNFSIDATGVCTPGGNGPFVARLSSVESTFKLDASLAVTGGRIYFSDSSSMISVKGVDPATSEFYYDWVEFSLDGAGQQLVVNTTQVDQFGFPIGLEVNPPDPTYGATAGSSTARAAVLQQFEKSMPEAYQACLYPNGQGGHYRIMSPNTMLSQPPSTPPGKTPPPPPPLGTAYDAAIDDFFTHYSKEPLYLNSDRAYPYVGKVTTVKETGSDGAQHDYSVLQFTFAYEAPINPGIPTTPPEGLKPYNIYYPFFRSNNPKGHVTFDGRPLLPPPQWWSKKGNAKGKLDPEELPSQMVFGCNGVFADDLYQFDILNPTPRANVLGNLENQVSTAFNRGYAQSWFTLTGSIAPSGHKDEATGLYTSVVTLGRHHGEQDLPNTTANLKVGMQVLSFSASIPLEISAIANSKNFSVTSPQRILAQNDLYLSFAEFYPADATSNAYAQFFHQREISQGGRAYAFPYDDQGGFSSTLTSTWQDAPSKLTIMLYPWDTTPFTPRTVDVVTVVDANTIMQAVAAGTLAAGTAAAPTSLGSWTESDKYIFMIADGSYVANNQGKSEIKLDCQVGDQIRWTVTNPSADFTYNCLLYHFVPNQKGIISQPKPTTKPVRAYHNNPGDPTVPVASNVVTTTWTSMVEALGDVQYSWAFEIVDNATGTPVGYFFWDPFIHVGE